MVITTAWSIDSQNAPFSEYIEPELEKQVDSPISPAVQNESFGSHERVTPVTTHRPIPCVGSASEVPIYSFSLIYRE